MKLHPIASSIAIAAAFLCGAAHADTTYTNTAAVGAPIYQLGAPDTTSYGEFFTAPGGVLKSFTFQALSGQSGNVDLTIAAWDGSKPVGPALYTSAPISYNGGVQYLGASGINLTLTAGTNYIAYLTVAGVSSPISNVTVAGSNSDGGLGGGFRFLNSAGADPLTQASSWSSWGTPAMAYTATFAAAVPEPETYGMLLAGLALVGVMARRKRA
ncbi:MAG TPA: PEP-CTERM sorting domain-containing protein [Burkholderiaceae bacterium]|nr:PEP-CTERM sorting domain-containing protein [Burkholderiaceae bacterium]